MQRPAFVTDGYYHVYNRGVAKQHLFHDDQDYRHLLLTLAHYLELRPSHRLSDLPKDQRRTLLTSPVTAPTVDILAYCLMPNHFHLILKQRFDDGISTFMRRAMNSYTRAYNTRYRRIGTVFQGRFSAVAVQSDEQLLHLSRYIHLNPVVARMVESPEQFQWSSFTYYREGKPARVCQNELVLDLAGTPERYVEFVNDRIAYGQELELIKHLTIEDE